MDTAHTRLRVGSWLEVVFCGWRSQRVRLVRLVRLGEYLVSR
jgi:hypothetical protein